MPRIGCLDEAAPAEFLGEAAADRRDRESLRRDKMREGTPLLQRSDSRMMASNTTSRFRSITATLGPLFKGTGTQLIMQTGHVCMNRMHCANAKLSLRFQLVAWNSHASSGCAARPTVLPIRILQLSPAAHLHLSRDNAEEQNIRLAVAGVRSLIIESESVCK